MARTLIICPTFDHADALLMSISSVRAQSDPDWEMVVIGDGAPARTADIVEGFSRLDPRIRFENHPKSRRTGEPYRDRVIRASGAEFVLHLGDDDIWSKDHVSAMLRLLSQADWAYQAPLTVSVSGQFTWNFANIGRLRALQAWSPYRIEAQGLNNVGYRRDAYLRLPVGWETTPTDQGTDLAMWAKFLADPDLRVASSGEATALKLPSGAARRGATSVDRAIEAGWYLARINDSDMLSDALHSAEIGIVPVKTMLTSTPSRLGSFEGAASACGWNVSAPDMPLSGSFGAEAMSIQLTSAQRDTLFFAFEIAQALGADHVPEALVKRARENRPLIGLCLHALSIEDHAMCERLIAMVDDAFRFSSLAQIGRLRLSVRHKNDVLTARLVAESKAKWPNAKWIRQYQT